MAEIHSCIGAMKDPKEKIYAAESLLRALGKLGLTGNEVTKEDVMFKIATAILVEADSGSRVITGDDLNILCDCFDITVSEIVDTATAETDQKYTFDTATGILRRKTDETGLLIVLKGIEERAHIVINDGRTIGHA